MYGKFVKSAVDGNGSLRLLLVFCLYFVGNFGKVHLGKKYQNARKTECEDVAIKTIKGMQNILPSKVKNQKVVYKNNFLKMLNSLLGSRSVH